MNSSDEKRSKMAVQMRSTLDHIIEVCGSGINLQGFQFISFTRWDL